MTELTTATEMTYADDAILAGRDDVATGLKKAKLSGLATYFFGKLFPSLTGNAGKYLKANATEDGVEWGTPAGGGGGSALEVLDEGVSEDAAVVSIDFVGAGVTATQTSAGNIEVNIPGGGGGATGVSPYWAVEPTPPVIADFGTPVHGSNVAGSFLADVSRGVQFGTYPTAINQNSIQLLPYAHPGGDWTFDVLINHFGRWRDHRSVGLYVRNTTSGKITSFTVGYSGLAYYLIQNYSNVNTFSGGAYAFDDRGALVSPIWLRLKYISSGTPRFEFWASRDGEQYFYIESYNVSSYVVSFDEVGVFSNNHNTGVTGVNGALRMLLMSADIY